MDKRWWWEKSDKPGVAAYYCFRGRWWAGPKPRDASKWLKIDDYVYRLPYNERMLRNRQAEGKDTPDWWKGD